MTMNGDKEYDDGDDDSKDKEELPRCHLLTTGSPQCDGVARRKDLTHGLR